MSRKKFFQRVGQTKIIPISLKIVAVFTVLLLLSNFATNTITLLLSQRQIINLNNTIMVSQLKDLYTAAGNQYQIFSFTGEKQKCIEALKNVSKKGFGFPKSYAAAIDMDGNIIFEVYADGTETDEQKILQEKLNAVSAEEKTGDITESLRLGKRD